MIDNFRERRERTKEYVTVTYMIKKTTHAGFKKLAEERKLNRSEIIDNLLVQKIKELNNVDITK